jgi:prophage regulatory protein
MATHNKKPIESIRLPLVLRKKQVLAMVGLSASTVYTLQKEGKFPEPIRLSKKAQGWLGTDIENWVAAKAARRPVSEPVSELASQPTAEAAA